MSTAEHERLQRIFLEACSLEGSDLIAFLDRACQGEPELRAEVEALLQADAAEAQMLDAAHDVSGAQLLANSLARSGEILAPSTDLPEQIGSFRILRLLGEGGMSRVYEAEQDTPRRRVALKVVQPSMMTASMLKRFWLETQIMAHLNHPGIAQVFEAGGVGEEAGGQPYFAMELVEGDELLSYAERHKLDSNERLELIARLCDIVHYAHQQGVIHRDLKPSNILVAAESDDQAGTGHAQIKVLDFGVARALNADIHRVTVQTNVGQLIGTIPYMSPEQAEGDPTAIDTRSDVYSIGVLAFELLTGRLPYEVRGKLLHEAVRVIRYEEPAKLSGINRSLRGDVETILGKALSKEKSRRYPSAAEFAADIRRLLADDAIEARPASAIYQFRKFARRNKVMVGGAITTLVVAIVGAVVATSFAISAERRAQDLTKANYAAGITAACGALDQEDYATAAYFLDGTPEQLRGWEYAYLRARLERQLDEWETPGPAVSRAVFDSAEQRMFAILRGGQVASWNVESGSFLGVQQMASSVLVDPTMVSLQRLSGESLRYASRAKGGGIVVGNLIAPEETEIVLEPGVIEADALAWTSSGQELLYQADAMWIWDGSSSRKLCEESFARGVFNQAGDRVALAIRFTVALFDAATGEELHRCRLDDTVTDLAFSPDGDTLAIAGHNRNIYLLDASNLNQLGHLPGHQALVFSLAWTRDGSSLITASRDGTMRRWEMASLGLSSVLATGSHGDTAVSLHPDGKSALSIGTKIQRFPLSDASVLQGHSSFAYRVSFAPDGEWLASSGFHEAQVYLWDISRAQLAQSFSPPAPTERGLLDRAPTLAISQDGERLVAAWDTGTWQWDTQSGEALPVATHASRVDGFWKTLGPRSPMPFFDDFGHSPDESHITASTANGVVLIQERSSKAEIGRLVGHIGEVYCAAYSPDGTRIATGGNDATVRIWNAQTFELLLILRGHDQYVKDVEFSPDGSVLASASGDRTIRLWDTMSQHERRAQAAAH